MLWVLFFREAHFRKADRIRDVVSIYGMCQMDTKVLSDRDEGMYNLQFQSSTRQ